jgi:3-dehydroquinate synthase II
LETGDILRQDACAFPRELISCFFMVCRSGSRPAFLFDGGTSAVGFSHFRNGAASSQRTRRPSFRLAVGFRSLQINAVAFWCEAETSTSLTAGLEAGIETFVFRGNNAARKADDWRTLAMFNSIVVSDSGSFTAPNGKSSGVLITCQCASEVDDFARRVANKQSDLGDQSVIILDTSAASSWSTIPAENLIAQKQSMDGSTQFFVVCRTADEAASFTSLLDIGVDGCVLRSDDVAEINKFGLLKVEAEGLAANDTSARLALATIVDVSYTGSGDRCCVDTCSMLSATEGLWIGNASSAMFLLLSEAVENGYVTTRPFRVNAGAVHSYTMTTDGRTSYLSELAAGSKVVTCEISIGPSDTERQNMMLHEKNRSVVVGRSKVENRPLLLCRAELADGAIVSVIVQNAETIRLASVSSDGRSIEGRSVVSLAVGDQVVVRLDGNARHLGMPIVERCVER